MNRLAKMCESHESHVSGIKNRDKLRQIVTIEANNNY